MGDGQDGRNAFDDMIESGGKVPATPAPSPAVSNDIPTPVADARTDHQPAAMQAGNQTYPVHGMTSAEAQQHVVPPQQQQSPRNGFDDIMEQNHPQASRAQAGSPGGAVAQAAVDREKSLTSYVESAWGFVTDLGTSTEPKVAKNTKPVTGDTVSVYHPSFWEQMEAGVPSIKRIEYIAKHPIDALQGRGGMTEEDTTHLMYPERTRTQEDREAHPIHTAVDEFLGDLTSPDNLILMKGLGAAGFALGGKLGPIIPRIASMVFGGQMAYGSQQEIKEASEHWNNYKRTGDAHEKSEAIRVGTKALLGAMMSYMSAKHVIKGDPELNANEMTPKTAKPEVSSDKRTTLRPANKRVANVDVPISAGAQEKPGVVTRIAESQTTPGEAGRFQATETKPAARKAAVSALSLGAETKLAAHNALVDGTVPKDPTEAEQEAPGKFTTPDEITDGLRAGANRTYDKARDISRQQQSDWQARYDAALEQHRTEVDAHNKQVSDWNSEPDNKDNRLDPMMTDARPDSLGVEERPKTFDELRAAVEEARGKTNPRFNAPDVVTKAREADLPKAEKALDDWFKDNEHLISHAEYSSAKSLWADAERFNDIANNLRGKLAKGTLTGNDIRGLEPLIDGKARRWNQAKGTGTFRRLVGDESYQNLQDIAKLFDPLDKGDPRKGPGFNSWGELAARHVLLLLAGGAAGVTHGLLGGAIGAGVGAVVGSLNEKFFNHVMFDPEFGSTFRDLAEATKDFFEKGIAVPKAIVSRMADLVQKLKAKGAGSETGAIGNVRQRNAGDFQATGEGLASPKFPKPVTPEVSKDDENITRGVIGTHDDMVSGLRGALGNDVFNPAKPTALPESVNRQGDPRTAPNLNADLQAQQMTRAEITAGKLPEKDFLKRAQELKDQILAQHTMAPDEGPVQVHHWSNQADLVETDPEFMGTGKAGEERARMDEPDFQKTTAFGTGDYREPRIQGQRYHYTADVNPLEYYNIEADPQGIWKKAFEKGGATAAEKAIRQAGYAGYRTSNQYRSFGKVPVRLSSNVSSQAILDYATKNGGFTINGREGFMRNQSGFSVAGEHKGLDAVLPADKVSPQDLAKSIDEYRNRPEVKEALKDPSNSLGGWFYKGNLHLEISKLMQDREAAIAEGRRLNQNSIYDHTNKNEISTGGNAADIAAAGAGAETIQPSMTHVPEDRTASEINTSHPRAVKSDTSIKASENRSNLATVDRATAAKPSGKTALGGETLGYEEKMARTVSKYDFMGDTEGMSHRAIIEKFVKHLSDNLEALWNMIPEELRNKTKEWYVGANKIAGNLGKKHGYTTEQSAGVIAALSPQNEWDNNLGLAERTMDIYRNQQNHPYTEEMNDVARNLSKADTVSRTFKKMLRDIAGKKLKDVVVKAGDRVEGRKVDAETAKDVQDARRAVWIRIYDEAYGSSTVKSWSPEGEVVGDSDRDRSWIGADHGQKAVSIMDNGSVEHINEVMGKGHKIRNFYNNIVNPNSLNGHVTVDTHAVGAAMMLPLAGDHVEVKHNFGSTVEGTPGAPQHAATGLSGTYPLYAEAYERTAKKLGVRPRELQSSTWDAIRTLFEPKAKAGLLPQARDIWQQVGEGKITADDARKQIVELAGGLKQPKWVSDEDWEKMGPEGDDTSFGAAAGAQPQMTSLSGEHAVSADVPPSSPDPETMKWRGQPQPQVRRTAQGELAPEYLRDAADWWNANDTPQNRLSTALHEVSHLFMSYDFGMPIHDAKIGLGHRPVFAGQPVGEGLGVAPITGVSGGFLHPGTGWRDAFNDAQTTAEGTHILKGFLTQLMAGRAAEEMTGRDPETIRWHIKGDVETAQNAMALRGIPEILHDQFLDMALKSAKRTLTENWDTIRHITQQVVQHPSGDLIDSGTFHKYRNGGVYGKP